MSYQSLTFGTAVRCLMLPHPNGETQSIAEALHECMNAMHDLKRDYIEDDSARKWLE